MSKKNDNKNGQADCSFGSGSPNHSSVNDQAQFEAYWKNAIRKTRMLNEAMANGDPIARMENMVKGVQLTHVGTFLILRQGLFKDQARNYAADFQLVAACPDPLGVCSSKPFIGRKVRHLPEGKAKEWLSQGLTAPLQMANPDGSILCPTRWIPDLPGRELSGKSFVTGREFDFPGACNMQERLYHNWGKKKFTLEVMVKAKEPDELGLQGSDPYLLRVLLPLSETKADLWVRQTGAPDVAPAMFVGFFRCLYTSLDPRGEFTLPAWRYPH